MRLKILPFFLGLSLLCIPSYASLHESDSTAPDASVCDVHTFSDLSCCFSDGTDPQRCLDSGMDQYAKGEEMTEQLLEELAQARASHETIERRCHEVVHAIGRYTRRTMPDVGRAFDACDHSCHSGCYHGVLETIFFTDEELEQGIHHISQERLLQKVPEICAPEQFADPRKSLIFQCQHGLGHAIMFTLEYDLSGALEACDALDSRYGRSSCYIGVFMESALPNDPSKRFADPDDLQYPCSIVEERYKTDCYRKQTQIWMYLGYEDDRIVDMCNALPSQYQSVCFQGLGRDTASRIRLNDAARPVHVCEALSGFREESCIGGVVYGQIDNSWDAQYAYRFCNALTDPWNRRMCFRLSNRYLYTLYEFSESDLRDQCDLFAEQEREMCISESSMGYWSELKRSALYLFTYFQRDR